MCSWNSSQSRILGVLLSLLSLLTPHSNSRAEETPPLFLFSTFAGSPGKHGAADGHGEAARFDQPTGVAVDASGNVFVADDRNATIRKITPQGVVTTIAGHAGNFGQRDGPGNLARFSAPISFSLPSGTSLSGSLPVVGKTIAVAPDGALYVVDFGNNSLRKVSPEGYVSTVAGSTAGYSDGNGEAALFSSPSGLRVEPDGNILIADTGNETVRRVTPAGDVTTVAGHPWFRKTIGGAGPLPPAPADGTRDKATFGTLVDIAVNPAGNIFVLDRANVGAVRKVASDGSITTIAGSLEWIPADSVDGEGSAARFFGATGMVIDNEGNIFVSETGGRRIRHVTPDGKVTTIAGGPTGLIEGGSAGTTDGLGTNALFLSPSAVSVDRDGNLYVADTIAHTIRKGTRVRKPSIATGPRSAMLQPGASIVLAVTAKSVVPASFQWMKDGTPIAGATGDTLALSNVNAAITGGYSVAVSNPAGTARSEAAIISLHQPPSIVRQPSSRAILGGQPLTLTVNATSAEALRYQWQKDGVDIPGATSATLIIENSTVEHTGSYRAIVTNPSGSVTTEAVSVTVNTTRIANLAVRAVITPNAPRLTVGFVVSGGAKLVLARAIGPGLRQFGVSTAHNDPRIAIFSGSTLLVSNDDWSAAGNPTQVIELSSKVGAFSLATADRDAAVLSSFTDGAYTTDISGPENTAGVVLVEFYDGDRGAAARLVNLSTRAHIGTGENILIAGFTVTGNAKKTLLIRAVGPTLSGFGVVDALADPKLELFVAGSSTVLAANDNWSGNTEIATAATACGAFPLASTDSKDAVLLINVSPGSYSAQVSGIAGTSGEALLELYEIQ